MVMAMSMKAGELLQSMSIVRRKPSRDFAAREAFVISLWKIGSKPMVVTVALDSSRKCGT